MKEVLQYIVFSCILCSFGIVSATAQNQSGEFQLDFAGKQIPVYYHLPKEHNSQTPVVIVLHGLQRDAQLYARTWDKLVEQYHIIVIIPLFTREQFPGANGYNLGNVFKATTESELKGQTKPTELNSESLWSLSVPDSVFQTFQQRFPQTGRQYTLYGHGAGAQFAHRFALFKSSNLVKNIIVANAGWFTFPNPEIEWPYGLKGVTLNLQTIQQQFIKQPLVLMSGLEDTKTENTVMRTTDQANQQGENRVIRAQNFYNYAQDLAKQFGLPLNWQKIVVEGAGHKDSEMAIRAVEFIVQQSR